MVLKARPIHIGLQNYLRYPNEGKVCVLWFFSQIWYFKTFGRIRNRRHFPSRTAIFRWSSILERLTVPRTIDQFGRKRCQKKRKDTGCKLNFSKSFSKVFCFTRTVGCQKFVQYIRMEQSRFMFLRGIVHIFIFFSSFSCILDDYRL